MKKETLDWLPIIVALAFGLYLLFRFTSTRKWYLKYFDLETTAGCGHKTKVTGHVTVKGKSYYQELSLNQGQASECFTCLSRQALTCVWCKAPIFSMTPMRVFQAMDEYYILPMEIELVSEDPVYLVGCTKRDCPGQNDELVKLHGFAPVKDSKGHIYEVIKQSILERRRKRAEKKME